MSRASLQYINGNSLQRIDNVLRCYHQAAQASMLTIVGVGTVDWAEEGNGEMNARTLPDSDLPATLPAKLAVSRAQRRKSCKPAAVHASMDFSPAPVDRELLQLQDV